MNVELKLRSSQGETGVLAIGTLPGSDTWRDIQTLEVAGGPDGDDGEVQLLEESEYEFALSGVDGVARVEPREMFSASSASSSTGRLRTRGRTGLVRIDVELKSGEVLSGEIEVRSRKLDYMTEYRWMLQRIADEAAALALSPFAASRLSSLADDHGKTAETLYQRFEFLRAQLDSEELGGAIDQLRHRPHMSFEDQVEIVSTTRPIRGGAGLGRQLTRPGSRRSLSRPIGTLTSVPLVIERAMHHESFDTVPNRFVRYVVQDWMDLVETVRLALEEQGDRADLPRRERGQRETKAVLDRLEELLRIPAIRDAGRLESFPASNTVVRGRSGYREFLSAFQTTNAHANLRWDQGEDLRSAGQHDVPTLYEYWVFLELVRIVETIPGFTADRSNLFEIAKNEMTLGLRKSKECLVRCNGKRNGQVVQLRVWFNRSFSHPGSSQHEGSWTVRMRPDVSIGIALTNQSASPEELTWLHFDAKYKVKAFTRDFVDSDSDADVSSEVLPADLQKMHAYRDAIRRSAGAYVIYPGTEDLRREQYHELLPGLGAFCLRPSSGGEADPASTSSVREFITEVIDHLVAGGTNLDRDRYWTDRVHGGDPGRSQRRAFLDKPQADTAVLLGFVRSPEHQAAIDSLGAYNLRADAGRSGSVGINSILLGSDVVVLYGVDGPARVFRASGRTALMRSEDLRVCGYEPSGELYLGVEIDSSVVSELDGDVVRALARQGGPVAAPIGLTWKELEQGLRVGTSD